jgi:hypothetical protein
MKFPILVAFYFSFQPTIWGQPAAASHRLFPVVPCPGIGEEYEKMLSRLDSIRSSIKSAANCENVALKVKSLEDLVTSDRERILSIIEATQASLSRDQAQQVRDYTENVTKKVASLMELFLDSNQCFEKGQADKQLRQLAGFVNEASQLVASISGPWGTPVAIAGNVVAGFLTGMDQVLQSRAGYDFRQRDQWVNYVENLCTYHSYSDQIQHLLERDAVYARLDDLKLRLNARLEALGKVCPECQTIQNDYRSQRELPERELSEQLQPHIQAANSHFNEPLGSYTLQSLGVLDWVLGEMKRLDREAKSYWGSVSGRHVLSRAKEQIEAFLITREAPRFLSHQLNQSGNDDYAFRTFVVSEARSIYYQLQHNDPPLIRIPVANLIWASSEDLFRSLVIYGPAADKIQNEEMRFTYTNFRNQSLNLFKSARASLQVVQAFCQFFKQANHYHAGIRDYCQSPTLRRLADSEEKLERELNAQGAAKPTELKGLEEAP